MEIINKEKEKLILKLKSHNDVVIDVDFHIASKMIPIIYLKTHIGKISDVKTLTSVILDLFTHLGVLHAHLYISSEDYLVEVVNAMICRKIGISRPENMKGFNYHIYEINRDDLDLALNTRELSSAKSYGLESEEFLNKEVIRLKSQNIIGGNYLEKALLALSEQGGGEVVDLGCGVGSLITPLAKKFVNLHFEGVDEQKRFIEEAQKNSLKNLSFSVGDIFQTFKSRRGADVFILRFVVQHIGWQGLSKLLEAFNQYSKSSSKLIIFESDDRLFKFIPSVAEADYLMEASGYTQIRYGGDRNMGLEIPGAVKGHGLKVDYFEIESWDTLQINFDDALKLSSPLFIDKPASSFFGSISKEHFYERIKQSANPYMRAGGTICVVSK